MVDCADDVASLVAELVLVLPVGGQVVDQQRRVVRLRQLVREGVAEGGRRLVAVVVALQDGGAVMRPPVLRLAAFAASARACFSCLASASVRGARGAFRG